jgi:hypothetical protein
MAHKLERPVLPNPNRSNQITSASPAIAFEPLEPRRLASASYVQVGKEIRPNIFAQVPSYFSANLPAGDYLIAVAGGSMTYSTYVYPVVYRVNDYVTGDYGFKVIEPGLPRFDAPGLSTPQRNSKAAAADSVGVYIKFHHPQAGKIGIELYDNPFNDNLAGADGSPVFILKERVVTPAPQIAAQNLSPALFGVACIRPSPLDLSAPSPDALDSFV